MAAMVPPQSEPRANAEGVHALTHKRIPGWVNWVQDNLLMSCLIVAEAYLLGTLMVTGWVPNLQTPSSWGVYSTIGVVIFFLAGATCAGVALRASFKAGLCFERGQVKMALINLLGCLILCTCEFWANLTERAPHLLPGVADLAVLRALGAGQSTLSPTLVIVALLLPIATFFVGFTHYNDAVPTQAERAARHADRLAKIQENNELQLARIKGMRAATQAVFQKPASASPSEPGESNPAPGSSVLAAPAPPEPGKAGKRGRGGPGNAFPGSPDYRKQMVGAIKLLQSRLEDVNAAAVASQMGRSEAEVKPYLDEYLATEREVANHH